MCQPNQPSSPSSEEEPTTKPSMEKEIQAASLFLTQFIVPGSLKDVYPKFQAHLENLMTSKFQGHWYPEDSARGNAFRCIRIDHTVDPLLTEACATTFGPDPSVLWPLDMALWIDPVNVFCTFKERSTGRRVNTQIYPMPEAPPILDQPRIAHVVHPPLCYYPAVTMSVPLHCYPVPGQFLHPAPAYDPRVAPPLFYSWPLPTMSSAPHYRQSHYQQTIHGYNFGPMLCASG